ncbi:MAG TPA: hypothetical protein VN889_01395, partial [Solirubrobacteraceae bacterium]|nr:hypothetical protein [Solirubrobacteraceae bacterium]
GCDREAGPASAAKPGALGLLDQRMLSATPAPPLRRQFAMHGEVMRQSRRSAHADGRQEAWQARGCARLALARERL